MGWQRQSRSQCEWLGVRVGGYGCEGEGEVQAESEEVKTYPLCKAT